MNHCLQNDIPLFTYNLPDMTSAEMEQSACQPYRLQQVLESTAPHVHRHRLLDLAMDNDLSEHSSLTHTIFNIEVIPGGRYIVTTSDSGWLRCWDLARELKGQDDEEYIEMKPEAQYSSEGRPIQGVWLQRTAESPSKIVAIIYIQPHSLSPSELRVLILNLSSEPQKSSFELQASLLLPWPNLWLLEGEYVLYVDDGMNVRVWNWRDDLWGVINDPTNTASADAPRGGLSNVMMAGRHIVLFNQTADGMTYRLYSLPKMHPTAEEAETNSENTLVQSVLFAPEGLDVDFPLSWRPAGMHPRSGIDDHFISIDSIGFVVVTYESSTRLFYLPDFLPWAKYPKVAEGTVPQPEDMVFPVPSIEVPRMTKRHFADHVRITSSFDCAYMVWFDAENQWWILPTRYSDHNPHHDTSEPSTSSNSSSSLPPFSPRVLGRTKCGTPRLCLSPTAGQAFYTEVDDRVHGYVHLWDWVLPTKGDPLGEGPPIPSHLAASLDPHPDFVVIDGDQEEEENSDNEETVQEEIAWPEDAQ
ncbi:hypothetical protein DL93DRAFT_991877 [Clavulina sp. PMI_390]|nr:hypothetical protein DL93DRAFT_991877 [Clavulina sp. PMI_390]